MATSGTREEKFDRGKNPGESIVLQVGYHRNQPAGHIQSFSTKKKKKKKEIKNLAPDEERQQYYTTHRRVANFLQRDSRK